MVKIDKYNFPDDLYYSDQYLWVKADGKIATIGASNFAAIESGTISYLDLIFREGEEIKAGKPFGSVESGKGATTLYAPVSGTIKEVDPDVEADPGLINKDCYGKAWIIKVESSSLAADLKKLFKPSSPEFSKWQTAEITKSKEKKKELGIE